DLVLRLRCRSVVCCRLFAGPPFPTRRCTTTGRTRYELTWCGSFGLEPRQIVALKPGVGNVLIAVVGVTDGGGEVGVDGVDEHDFRGPNCAQLLFVFVVVRDLEQAAAIGVELALDRMVRALFDPVFDAVVDSIRRA